MNLSNSNGNLRSILDLRALIAVGLLFNLAWTLLSVAINQESLDGLTSSLRLMFSFIIGAYLWDTGRNKVELSIVIFAVINAALVCVQVYESVNKLDLLPDPLRYGYIWGFEEKADFELIRKGGFLPSLQTSSMLSLLAMFVIAKSRFSLLLRLTSTFLLMIVLLFGSRMVLVLGLVLYVIYLVLRGAGQFVGVFVLAVSIFLAFVSEIESVSIYIQDRIVPAIEVFIYLDPEADYSAADTKKMLRTPVSFQEWVFGNGCTRFSECGGGDPMYSRWLMQNGFPTAAALFFVMLCIGILEWKNCGTLGLLTLFLIIHAMKDEVLTSVAFFDIYLAFVLMPDDRK